MESSMRIDLHADLTLFRDRRASPVASATEHVLVYRVPYTWVWRFSTYVYVYVCVFINDNPHGCPFLEHVAKQNGNTANVMCKHQMCANV